MSKKTIIYLFAIAWCYMVLAGTISLNKKIFHNLSERQDNLSSVFTGAIETTYLSPTNSIQNGSTIWFGAWKGQLLFAADHSGRFGKGKLLTLHDGIIEEKGELYQSGSVEYIGSSESILYYWHYEKGQVVLCGFDLEGGQLTELYSAQFAGGRKSFFCEDGSVFVPIVFDQHEGCLMYLHVCENNVIETVPFEETYYLGEWRYDVVASSAPWETILFSYANGSSEELVLAPGDQRIVIPTDDGLIIHNKGRQTLLYFIDKSGNCSELFSVPCSLSDSVVALYHDKVFVSVMRYAKGSALGKGFVGFENDTLSGTYRIDLTDFSVEKISDLVFTGMYIFNDSGIYACDKNLRMYKIGFNGNVIDSMDWPGIA